MLSNNQHKLINSLSQKKYRLQQRKFVVEGEKMVAEFLAQQLIPLSAIFGLQHWADTNADLLQPFLAKFQAVTEAELKKISSLKTPNAVVVIAEIPEIPLDTDLPGRELCFYLDDIQDPGNVGTILRIADWFGLPAVFCSPNTADVYNTKVVQASMGAIFRIKTWEVSIANLLESQPELLVSGAVLDGENVFETNLPNHGLLVIGNEGRGISAEVLNLLTHRISIPRHPNGAAESLNAAVAAGILAAMFSRGRATDAVRR